MAPGYLIYNIVTQQGLIRGNGGAPAGQIRLNAAGILGGSGTRQQAAVMPDDRDDTDYEDGGVWA